MNARYGDSGVRTLRSRAQDPPTTAGSSTLCPRLDTGNSSATPGMAPTTPASSQLRWWCTRVLPVPGGRARTMRIMAEQPAGARTLALGTAERRPAWLRATEGEHRWWIVLALVVTIAAQFALPGRFVVHPAYIAPTIEAVLLVVLTVMHPDRLSQRTQQLRVASQVLLAIIAITNATSVVLLIHTIT